MKGRIRKSRVSRKSVWRTEPPAAPPAGGGGDQGGDQGGGGGGQKQDPPAEEKQLPQSRVNEIVTAETKKAAEKATADLAAQLGVSVDEAKAIIKAHQERVEGEKSEAQKAREAADREKTEAEKAKAEAQAEIFATRADRALVSAGADPEDDEGLARLRKLLDVAPGATVDEIKADVKKVAEKFPALFESQPQRNPRTPGSDPKGGGRQTKSTDNAMTRGMERAQARYKSTAERPKPAGMS